MENNENCPECSGNMYLVHVDKEKGDPEYLAQCEDCKALYIIE